MGLDSVEIVLEVEESFGIDIPNEEAERMLTPRQLAHYISRHVPLERGGGCRFQRCFFRLRAGFKRLIAHTSVVERETRLKDILPSSRWRALWTSLREEVGAPDWPASVPWPKFFFSEGPRTVGELAWYITLFPVGQASFTPPWTREKIGLEVRRIVFDVMGKLDYSLDAGFVKDLGVT